MHRIFEPLKRVPLADLPSGLHTMNLQLLNPDGADSGVGFGTEFEVHPPFRMHG